MPAEDNPKPDAWQPRITTLTKEAYMECLGSDEERQEFEEILRVYKLANSEEESDNEEPDETTDS